jgi:hypothetical protein
MTAPEKAGAELISVKPGEFEQMARRDRGDH